MKINILVVFPFNLYLIYKFGVVEFHSSNIPFGLTRSSIYSFHFKYDNFSITSISSILFNNNIINNFTKKKKKMKK